MIKQRKKESFLKYLFIQLAPMLTDLKPSVLLRLHRSEFPCSSTSNGHCKYEMFCSCRRDLAGIFNAECFIMKESESDIQVLFYKKSLLYSTLENQDVKDCLKRCGYDDGASLTEMLIELRTRFNSKDFPHEIGIFLGYPLKDVEGFMNGSDEYIPEIKGLWRIFGNPDESIMKMRLFSSAKSCAKALTDEYSSIHRCFEVLRSMSSDEILKVS